jgi:hypothetical protein
MFMMDYNIIVDSSSINLIKEFNNYSWSDKTSGQPIDKWNHAIDSCRYIVQYHKQNSGGIPFYIG